MDMDIVHVQCLLRLLFVIHIIHTSTISFVDSMVIGKTHGIRIVCFQLRQGNSEELVASNLWIIISHLLIKIDYNITRKILTSSMV